MGYDLGFAPFAVVPSTVAYKLQWSKKAEIAAISMSSRAAA